MSDDEVNDEGCIAKRVNRIQALSICILLYLPVYLLGYLVSAPHYPGNKYSSSKRGVSGKLISRLSIMFVRLKIYKPSKCKYLQIVNIAECCLIKVQIGFLKKL